MAKGYCIYCKNLEDKERVFDINFSNEKCYCPNCRKEMTTFEANKKYNEIVEHKISIAEKCLLKYSDYLTAYQCYANVLDLDKTNLKGLLGRLTSLTGLSTVRRGTFSEVNDLLMEYKDSYDFNSSEACSIFLLFARIMYTALTTYLVRLKKALTTKKQFYDVECLSLYFERVNAIYNLSQNIYDLCISFKTGTSINNRTKVISLKNFSDNLSKILQSQFLVVEGFIYQLSSILPNNKVLVAKVGQVNGKKYRVSKFVLATLDYNDKHKIIIKDRIFYNLKPLRFLNEISLFLSLAFIVPAIIFLITTLIYKDNSTLFVLSVVLTIIFFVLFVIFLSIKISTSLYFKNKNKLSF